MEGEGGSLVGSLAGRKPLAPQDSSPHLRGSGFRWSGGSAGTYVVRAGHAVGLVVYDVGDEHRAQTAVSTWRAWVRSRLVTGRV